MENNMIQSILFDPGTKSAKFGGSELIKEWHAQKDSVLWLDIGDTDQSEELSVLRDFGFHELAIQDALRKRHPPKIEVFENYIFFLLRDLASHDLGIDSEVAQLALFVGDRLVVTRHRETSATTNWVYQRIKSNPLILEEGAPAIALRICNRLVRRYVRMLIEFEVRLDDLEEEMFAKPSDDLLSELTGYKSRLRYLKRNASYHKLIASLLKENRPELFSADLAHEIIDLYEQIERTGSLSELYYDVLKDLSDGYLALSSHRLNRVMQFLTVITVIFVPLTFLAGIYGMNFDYMPELNFRSSYFMVLGVMLTVAISQLFLFRRKGWL